MRSCDSPFFSSASTVGAEVGKRTPQTLSTKSCMSGFSAIGRDAAVCATKPRPRFALEARRWILRPFPKKGEMSMTIQVLVQDNGVCFHRIS